MTRCTKLKEDRAGLTAIYITSQGSMMETSYQSVFRFSCNIHVLYLILLLKLLRNRRKSARLIEDMLTVYSSFYKGCCFKSCCLCRQVIFFVAEDYQLFIPF